MEIFSPMLIWYIIQIGHIASEYVWKQTHLLWINTFNVGLFTWRQNGEKIEIKLKKHEIWDIVVNIALIKN